MGGTLDGPGVAWRPRFERLYRDAGVLAPGAPDDAFRRAFFDADDRLPERHALEKLGFEATVRLQVGDTLANLGRGEPALLDRIAGAFVAECRASFRAARRVLESLAARHPLGVVSNFYGNLRACLASEGLLELFREGAVIDSRELGVEKPDARIFHAACSALGVPATEVAHVGDSWPRDVVGARGAGLIPIWLAPGEVGNPEGVVRIDRLEDLEAALEGALAA